MRRNVVGAIVIGVAAAVLAANPAPAQSYPDRSVRIIIAFAAGGTIDTLGRIVAQKLGDAWGQSVFVENRPGAGGNIGAQAAAQSAPDGTTLHLGGQTLAVNVTLAPLKGFDPVRDLEPVIWIATARDVLMVPPSSPFRSAGELIAYAKAHPSELNYASLGPGSSGHLATTLFGDLAGIKLQHVPYNSFSQAVTDMIAGRISLWISTLGGAIGNIQAGKMRARRCRGGNATRSCRTFRPSRRSASASSTRPAGTRYSRPRATPKEIVGKINADMNRILARLDMKERELTLGYRFIGGTPDALARMFRAEIAKWADVANSASLK